MKNNIFPLILGVAISTGAWTGAVYGPKAIEYFIAEPVFNENTQALMDLLDDKDSWELSGSASITHKKKKVTIINAGYSNSHLRIYGGNGAGSQTSLFDGIGYINVKAKKVLNSLQAERDALIAVSEEKNRTKFLYDLLSK